MANQSPGLLGQKIGMTQIYDQDGHVVPVTVIDLRGNTVLAVKRTDGPDGYPAVQLGVGVRKAGRTTRALAGVFAKAGVAPLRWIREVRVTDEQAATWQPGQVLGPGDLFAAGELVDVTGTSKGRGTAGVMKRHNFTGFIRTHGTHEFFRHGGSIGTRLTPGMVLKGKKMGGHMGAARVTTQNQRVVKIDAERGLLFVRGGVPGPNGGLVLVRKAVKQRK